MYKDCPKCGAVLRSESTGWICPICQTFVDIHGGVHLHKEEPFVPPMTNGNRFRAKTDEDLAEFLSMFVGILDCPRSVWDDVDRGMRYVDAWLKWLQQPVNEKDWQSQDE